MSARRRRLGATTEPRNLRRQGESALQWRRAVGGRAPRLGAGEYIGTGVTRTGRFAKVDPLSTPRLWNRWRWLGLLFWAGLTGEAARRAYRQHRPPREQETVGSPMRQG